MKAVLSFILAFYVLIGSLGTPFSKHTCYASDITEYGFSVTDNCCSGKEPAEPIKVANQCCDFSSTYFQVDFKAFSFSETIALSIPFEFIDFNYHIPTEEKSSATNISEGRLAPLIYGRSLLVFVQTFII